MRMSVPFAQVAEGFFAAGERHFAVQDAAGGDHVAWRHNGVVYRGRVNPLTPPSLL